MECLCVILVSVCTRETAGALHSWACGSERVCVYVCALNKCMGRRGMCRGDVH